MTTIIRYNQFDLFNILPASDLDDPNKLGAIPLTSITTTAVVADTILDGKNSHLELAGIFDVAASGSTYDDHEFLSELLKRHPEAPKKIGVGIQKFKVMEMNYGTRGFHVERTDESSTDFSFHDCIKRAHPAIKSRVASAFRVIVAGDSKAIRAKLIREQRRADGKIRCKKTENVMTQRQCI